MLPSLPEDFNPKSFWEKPEGTTGMIVMIAAVIAGAIGLYHLLPAIIVLLQNTLYALGLIGIIAAIVGAVMNQRIRTLASFAFKSVMRAITGVFVEIDPIGILKNYVDDLKQSAGKMKKHIGKLRGEMQRLKAEIEKNQADMKDALNLAKEAQKNQKKQVMVLKARHAGRLKDSNITLEKLYQKMVLDS